MKSDVRRQGGAWGWLVAVVPFLVGVAILTSAVFFPVRPVVADVGPRPTVELVKVFECNTQSNYNYCSQKLEDRVNGWLQEKQPGIRIVGRSMASAREFVYVIIDYEVLEWRTQQKPLAEAVR